MPLPSEYHKAAVDCYENKLDTDMIARHLQSAISYCTEHNIAMLPGNCPYEIVIMTAILAHKIGLGNAIQHKHYDTATTTLILKRYQTEARH